MESRKRLGAIVPALALAISLAVPVSAQDSSSGAQNESVAGSGGQQAGAGAEQWASGVYDSTKTAVDDSLITLKIKIGILKEKAVAGDDIHVSTQNGVVTLAGKAHSALAVTQAEQIARATGGVRDVTNKLGVATQTTD
jgi:osmotically-inducible protein OsmY